MEKLLVVLGAMVGGWLGGTVGTRVGGLWYGRKVGRDHF